MPGSQNGYIKTRVSASIATVEFFHPSHNALPSNLLEDLSGAIEKMSSKDIIRVIALKSGGDRTFCAGASFDELRTIKDSMKGKQFFMGFARVINAMKKSPKILVCRVQGKAVGGGVGLAAAADYCMANKYASVRLSELSLGFGPFVIGPAVERKIEKAGFAQLALNPGEWQTADWAKQRGLFQEVFDSTAQLDEYFDHYCRQIASKSAQALEELKKILWQGTDDWEDLLNERAALSGKLVVTPEAQKALREISIKQKK